MSRPLKRSIKRFIKQEEKYADEAEPSRREKTFNKKRSCELLGDSKPKRFKSDSSTSKNSLWNMPKRKLSRSSRPRSRRSSISLSTGKRRRSSRRTIRRKKSSKRRSTLFSKTSVMKMMNSLTPSSRVNFGSSGRSISSATGVLTEGNRAGFFIPSVSTINNKTLMRREIENSTTLNQAGAKAGFFNITNKYAQYLVTKQKVRVIVANGGSLPISVIVYKCRVKQEVPYVIADNYLHMPDMFNKGLVLSGGVDSTSYTISNITNSVAAENLGCFFDAEQNITPRDSITWNRYVSTKLHSKFTLNAGDERRLYMHSYKPMLRTVEEDEFDVVAGKGQEFFLIKHIGKLAVDLVGGSATTVGFATSEVCFITDFEYTFKPLLGMPPTNFNNSGVEYLESTRTFGATGSKMYDEFPPSLVTDAFE